MSSPAPPAGSGAAPREVIVRGPAFEDLTRGQVFDTAPPVTLTDGLAAAHQAIVGERGWLALSRPLAAEVLGGPAAPPSLVWNLSIGQSTLATQRVLANLYYRGLVLRRQPYIGDTLHTSTQVTGLRQNRPRDGRPATGLAALRVTTRDQHGAIVLDFERCAMIPLRDPALATGWQDDLAAGQREIGEGELLPLTAGWALARPALPVPAPGTVLRVEGRDVVSSGPELARLTMNIAAVHHDAAAAGGRRLVYGGHTIALALTQATRAIPNLLTVLAWHSCDHTAPVHEGDMLSSAVEVERATPLVRGGALLHLRSRVRACDQETGAESQVLDWRFVAVCSAAESAAHILHPVRSLSVQVTGADLMSEDSGNARGGFPRRQLSDEVVSYVRELIMSGNLRPGDFIRQERIADELELSATPVREGLLSLRGEGFVELKPRRGFVVAPLSASDVRDLFTAQALLAGELVSRAAVRMSPEDLRELTEVHEALRQAAADGDGGLVESLNHDFHRRINRAADAPRLAWMLSISTKFAPRRFFATIPGWSRASAQDHAAIIGAITAGDAAAARAAMMQHMENAGELLAANFESVDAVAQSR
ncbi:MAG TPA: FCD domain-containing protein [Trebonia sp.]